MSTSRAVPAAQLSSHRIPHLNRTFADGAWILNRHISFRTRSAPCDIRARPRPDDGPAPPARPLAAASHRSASRCEVVPAPMADFKGDRGGGLTCVTNHFSPAILTSHRVSVQERQDGALALYPRLFNMHHILGRRIFNFEIKFSRLSIFFIYSEFHHIQLHLIIGRDISNK